MNYQKTIGLVIAGVVMLGSTAAQARISPETGLKHSRTAKVTTVSHKKHKKHSKHHKHHAKKTSSKTTPTRAAHKTA
jgi:hypothetical protein